MDIDTTVAIAVNVVAYASLAGAVIQWNRQKVPKPVDGVGAFHLLDSALRRSFPDLPMGFTLREGVSRAKVAGLSVGWESIDQKLAEYEAFRFGGGSAPSLPLPEVMRLVKALRRRR